MSVNEGICKKLQPCITPAADIGAGSYLICLAAHVVRCTGYLNAGTT